MSYRLATYLTLGALAGDCWTAVVAAGLVSAAAAVGVWLLASAKGKRVGSFSDVIETSSPILPPAKVVKKKAKKSVKFDLDRNETKEVDSWYVETWGMGACKHHEGVRWGLVFEYAVDRYLEPDGHNQLHFPQTKYIRDVPSWDAENDDGDIDMLDV